LQVIKRKITGADLKAVAKRKKKKKAKK